MPDNIGIIAIGLPIAIAFAVAFLRDGLLWMMVMPPTCYSRQQWELDRHERVKGRSWAAAPARYGRE